MKRSDARALAVTTLTALNIFDQVLDHAPDSLAEPVTATVHSSSFSMTEDARELISAPAEIMIGIWVRRTAGQGSAAEAQLDDLVRQAAVALAAAFGPFVAQLQIGPSETHNAKLGDGKNYRLERFPVRVDDDYEE